MQIPFNPLMFVTAGFMGAISAYLAFKRGKNTYLWFAIGFLFGIFGIFAIFFASQPKKKPLESAPKQPVYVIDGPNNKFWYYLDPSHNQLGPMSHDALTNAWMSGKISLTTYVWNEELPDWKLLKDTLKAEMM